MYKVGDYLMHESSGVCQVKEISEQALMGKGSERLYYNLEPVFQKGSQIMTPVDSKARIRDVKSAEEIQALLEQLPSLEVVGVENNRQRTEKFKEIISEFTPGAVAVVVKSVYLHQEQRLAAGKKAMSSDERVMEVASRRLFEEMAFVLDQTLDEVKDTFFEMLEEERTQSVAKGLGIKAAKAAGVASKAAAAKPSAMRIRKAS